MIRISVIIPVYNAEKYLRECLDSVVAQTLKEIEIICIDDGSEDSSMKILKEYAYKDTRIKVLHQKNMGVVSARKQGVSISSGEYIGFIDSDDWIEPDMYENLYLIAAQNNIDFVTSGYYKEGNYTTIQLDNLEEGIYQEEQMNKLRENCIYNVSQNVLGISGSMCCKLYKADMLKPILNDIPNEMIFSEDKMCNLLFALNCDSAYILKRAYYHYRMQENSVVNTAHTDYLLYVNSVYKFLTNLYCHPKFTPNMRTQAELYITEMLIHGINTRMGFANRNMLWLDPYWLDRIPLGAGIVLYGAGELGEKYRQQLYSRSDLKYIGCMDYGYEKYLESKLNVQSPSSFSQMDYDYIVITIKNKRKADEVRQQLIKEGIKAEKILWFEQKEIYWKFAEAEGLLKRDNKVQDET